MLLAMAETQANSTSHHIRLKMELAERIHQRMQQENRTFNNACETLLYEAIQLWEQKLKEVVAQ